jgi:hypothetical protein
MLPSCWVSTFQRARFTQSLFLVSLNTDVRVHGASRVGAAKRFSLLWQSTFELQLECRMVLCMFVISSTISGFVTTVSLVEEGELCLF